jgi:hypothetical protein
VKDTQPSNRFLVQLALVIAFCISAFAQQTAPPAPQAEPKPLTGLERYRNSRISIFMNDFGELTRYRDANATLKPPTAGENRVVFFGDSITDMWKLDEYFPGKPYINLHPKVVVILAGTNDIAGNTGPMSLDEIEANYASLAELAAAHQIRVMFSSVLPVHNYMPQSEELFSQRSPAKILALNRWLKNYCASNRCVYLDYFSAMVDDKGWLKKDLAEDGLHPNQAGYKIMAPLAESAIAQALSRGAH